MDLGTILREVEASLKGRGSGKYSEPSALLADVQLTWDNCNRYNHNNPPILEACARCRQLFEGQWRAAGLSGLGGAAAAQAPPPAAAAVAPAPSDHPAPDAAVGEEWELRRGARGAQAYVAL